MEKLLYSLSHYKSYAYLITVRWSGDEKLMSLTYDHKHNWTDTGSSSNTHLKCKCFQRAALC